jgi:hypothetical protein
VFRALLTRIGYAALGAVYAAVGVVALRVAVVGSRDRASGFAGALRFLLEQPHGPIVLAARLVDAADRRRSRTGRVVALADALAHAGLAWLAVALALGLRRGRGATRPFLAWLLTQTWGKAALEVAAILVFTVGLVQLWQGLRGYARRQLKSRELGAAAPYVIRVGRFGVTVRGIVTLVIGWFLHRTAQDADVHKFHEIGGALEVLHTMRFGGLLLAIAGAGLCAYGVYLVLLGFYRRPR